MDCVKIMILLENIPTGSVWDTFISKSPPELTQSGTTQPSDKVSNVKENSKKSKKGKANLKTPILSKMKKARDVVKDDDDNDSLFGNPNICNDMIKNKEMLEERSVELFVSKRMQDKSCETTLVFVAFSPPKNSFHVKDEYFRIICSTQHNLVHPGI